MNPQNAYSITQSAVVNVGSTGAVEIRARGEIIQDTEVSATADPTIVIDPDATFEVDGTVHFYADEFEIEYSDTIVQWTPCAPDINNDSTLDFFDVSDFLSAFSSADAIADFNGDGSYDFFDVSMFLNQFLAGCP